MPRISLFRCDPNLGVLQIGIKSQDTVMSDSEDSTVTYTEVSSPFEVFSNIGSPGVDGPPIKLEDPYAYVVDAFHAPLSPNYVPGPEEPQAPLPPDFSNLEDESKEDEEDPDEDPADYPTDKDDDDEEEEGPSKDDADDEEDEKEDEEEEHSASADSVPPPPVHRVTARMSVR
ncbi:hypothetical protein Tco_1575479, partial [Tanacetum coccineum]